MKGGSLDARLPIHPHLGFYRKLAKQLKRAILDRDATAVDRLAQTHPRFRDPAGAAAAAGSGDVALSDAQLVIAREHGFASWPELKAAVERVAAEPVVPPADRFIVALRAGDAEEVRALLASAPALARTPDSQGAWPLVEACDRGMLDVVDLLLAAGADPNQASAHTTPLYAAAHAGPHKPGPALEVVSRLFAHGAADDVFAHAVLGRSEALAADLIRGSDVNARGPLGATPLFLAVWGGHLESVRKLLGAGADPNVPGRGGQSVWQCVLLHLWSEPHRQVARLLLDHGLSCALHDACRLAHAPTVQRLLAEDPQSKDRPDENGLRPLDIAVLNADVELARQLLAAGADDPKGQARALVDAEPRRNQSFRGSVYRNCTFQAANFHDVQMADTTFSDVNLAGARFDNVNLAGARIDHAHIRGLRIYGIEIEPLLTRELEKRKRVS